jgi:SNF2 family DNA or RNA helicase
VNTLVEIAAGRIVVRPSFADMLTCSRLGGKWEIGTRAWVFPATEQFARLLRSKLRAVAAIGADALDGLLQPATAVAVQERQAQTPAGQVVAPVQKLSAEAPAAAVMPGVLPADPSEPEVAVPPGVVTPPWRHQKDGFKFCLDKFAAGMRGILLAMGMGTGKSLVACMVVLAVGARRALIACPLRVVPVWITQFERHVGIPIVIIALDEDAGPVAKKAELAAEKLKLAQAHGVPFIVVINYDSAWREPFAQWAQKIHWDLVIADEVHKIKAATGRASKFFARLAARADYRLGLTGTPIPHNHTDIFGILRFVDMAILGRYWGPFKREYCQMGGYQNKQVIAPRNLPQLEQKVARVMFRVGKEVLDLPPETLITYRCELSPEGRRVYRSLDEYFVAGVKDGTITVTNAMVKVQRLAQLTGGWVPTDDGEPCHVDDSKQKLLEDTLDDIGDMEPAAVFCWFHQDLDAVHDACRRLGYTSLELSGRRDELKQWQDGGAQVLAVQIRSGGAGVDFTRARYSIFYSLGFSLADYEQAKSRVHRPGQTRPVEHIHLVAKGTVDERIMRALEKRAEVIEAILAEIAHS